MPRGWEEYIDAVERGHWLSSLTVSRTKDEFGNYRYFVEDFEGNWIEDPFDSAEAAFEKIDHLRKEG